MSSQNWESIAKAKRQATADAIPEKWRLKDIPTPDQCPNVMSWPNELLSLGEVEITETPPMAVLANIHAAIWTSEEVTRAYCHRAAIAHQLVNCLVEVLFEQAILRAQELDRFQQTNGQLCGPLHGLPISFMDRFRIQGAESAAGFISYVGVKESAQTESLLVKHVRKLGAIPFCKTTVPQSLLLGNTTNNINGPTLNPHNRLLSAGGAAGGEGALLAMRGSPFGWATEVAGSARIPAVLNGIFALKSTAGRLSSAGLASSTIAPICRTTIAMMSWDLTILEHLSRLVLGSPGLSEDPEWLDMPWRESAFQLQRQARPAFAIFRHDTSVQPQPPISRALSLVELSLRRHGFEIIDWDPPPHLPAVQNLFKLVGADGASQIRECIRASGEPAVPQLRKWYSDPGGNQSLSITEYWKLAKARSDYIAAYRTYWNGTKHNLRSGKPVDGVIMPVLADAAAVENSLEYYGYSAIVNHLDCAAVAFPVTTVDPNKDIQDLETPSLNAEDAKVQVSYDPTLFKGQPVGLQVMCRRGKEEEALALTNIILRALSDGFTP